MRYVTSVLVLGVITLGALSGCGGGPGGYYVGGGGPPPLVSYVGTTGVFAAWADPDTGNSGVAPLGSYAGKKQVLRGSVDFHTGVNLSQPAGIEVYKGSDGHIYGLGLTTIGVPAAEQLSTEAGATVLPAAPGFYHRPERVEDLVDFVVQRVLDHIGVEVDLAPRWAGKAADSRRRPPASRRGGRR